MHIARTVTVFKGHRKADTYLYLADDADPSSLPEALLSSLGELQQVMTLELTPQRRLARVEAAEVLNAIERQGFYLQMPPRSESLMKNDRLLY
ncbi:MAG: YcgL domain-containing protein [Xanthomonadales bacterium]|nr:YcgL domain-containing protein [Xanthomonadales bacterium]